MSRDQNIVIYVNNLDTQNPTSQQLAQLQHYANELSNSEFTTAILWALHVDSEGNFIYNGGDPMISGGQLQSCSSDLPGLLSTVKRPHGTVKRLLFSIGGWGCERDFIHIGNLIKKHGTGPRNPIYQNFQALQSALSIDGIDFDLEPDPNDPDYHPYPFYRDVVIELTLMLAGLGLNVTYCPYEEQTFWLDCMASAYKKNNSQQPVGWWNLQCYDGGSFNTQSAWVQSIEQSTEPLGIENPAAFIVPGYGVPGISPTGPGGLVETFSNPENMAVGINGGFLFNFEGVLANPVSGKSQGSSTRDYAHAIIKGISALDTTSDDSPSAAAGLPAREAPAL